MGRDEATPCGAREYQDALEQLSELGLEASFVDDRGSAALEVELDGGQVLLVTEVDGPLPRLREDHRSWGVSLHRHRGASQDEEPVAWDGTQDGALGALMPLISGVLLDTMRGPSAEL